MSKLKDYLINTLFLIVLCTLIIGIYYSIKYQIANGHTKEVVSEVVAFLCVVVIDVVRCYYLTSGMFNANEGLIVLQMSPFTLPNIYNIYICL